MSHETIQVYSNLFLLVAVKELEDSFPEDNTNHVHMMLKNLAHSKLENPSLLANFFSVRRM